MTANTTLTTAWQRIRERVTTRAATYRNDGDTVLELFADHGAVRQSPDQPVTFSFTIPDDDVAELRDRVGDSSSLWTNIEYVDVTRTRLYVLVVHAETAELRILVAGGIRHQALGKCPETDRSARTVLRSATGTVGLELHHSDCSPFLADLDYTGRRNC
jgi:hypothetical protein